MSFTYRDNQAIAITIYAVSFAELNFCGFRGLAAIRESLILQKFRPVCRTIASHRCKKKKKMAAIS